MYSDSARRVGWIGFVLATVLGSLGNACNSAEHAAAAPATSGTGLSFAASAASQTELGVVSWKGVTNEEETTIRGVDANGKTMLSMDARIYDESGVHHVSQQVTQGTETATIDLQTKTMNGEPALHIDSTLAASSDALRRALALLVDDAMNEEDDTTVTALGSSTSSTASIGFRDTSLVQKTCSTLQNCTNEPYLQVTSAMKAGLSCTNVALIAYDGWTSVENMLGGDGVAESTESGVTTSSCFSDVETAWKDNFENGPLDNACKQTADDGCPISTDTPCYPGCLSGMECDNGQCQIAPQKSP